MERMEGGQETGKNKIFEMSAEEIQALDLEEVRGNFAALREGDETKRSGVVDFRDSLNQALDMAHDAKDQEKASAISDKMNELKDIMYPSDQ